MKLVPVVSWVMSAIILYSGFLGYQTGSLVSLIVAALWAGLLCVTGLYSWQGNTRAGYISCVLTFLLAVYFAYRFISSESVIPAGVLLMVTFGSLFLLLLGVFLGLKDEPGFKD